MGCGRGCHHGGEILGRGALDKVNASADLLGDSAYLLENEGTALSQKASITANSFKVNRC